MTVNIFDLMELARRKPDAISLGLGDPDLPTPPHIVAAAAEAIRDGRTGPASRDFRGLDAPPDAAGARRRIVQPARISVQ